MYPISFLIQNLIDQLQIWVGKNFYRSVGPIGETIKREFLIYDNTFY